ncbi:MAG: SurA N-terminal domain-containing protein [Planctomycetes bacterium]|uniref:SurA N-terminal domain-containing protein n=1 Tax=Candidatus Wunengus sp. YC65 TaxID=3367701 RepID=UPI001D4ED800|nr:SurA N-terminal domain-containing protein [Planctomycetota bacterium]
MVSSSWFRRHQKTVYIVMIFAMFVWGISYSAMEMIPKKPIGKIFGRKVTQNEFADMLGRWQRLFFSQAKDSIVSLVWKQLLFVEEAKRMGIVVTAQEVESALQGLAFQIFGGEVNMPRSGLLQFLCNNFRLNTEQIDRTIREALLVEKLEALLRSSTKMTTEEIWQRYSLENEQVKFKVLSLKAKDFLDSANVTEDEIRVYYEKYKNDEYKETAGNPGYKLPESVKLECLIAKFDDMEKLVSVKEEEMKKYYEDAKETQFKITSVEPKPEESKENKAAAKDASTTDKKNSKKEGKETTNDSKPQEKKSSLIHKPFAEVKEEIRKTLARQMAMEKAAEIMNKLDEEIYETMDKAERPSFKDLATKYNVTYEIPKGKKSKNEFLTENDLTEVLPGSDQIVQVAFERDKYEPSVPFDFVEGKVVFQVVDKRPSAPAPFEEVRNSVINDLKLEKGFLKAKELAEKYAGTTKSSPFDDIVKSIKAECQQKDISVCETGYISRPVKLFNKESRYIDALKEDRPGVAKKAFELKPGLLGVAAETSGEKACYIIALLDKKAADKSAFERDRENVTKRYLYEKQETFLADWQSDISRHMEIYTKFQ